MNRLRSLHESRLVSMLNGLQTDLDNLKTAQRVSAASGSIISYVVQNSGSYDYVGTIGTDSDISTITSAWSITYAGDGSQSPVMANLIYSVFVNGTDAAHQVGPSQLTWSDGFGRTVSANFTSITETRTTYAINVTLVTFKAITVRIKGMGVSSSPGTLTVTKIL